METIIERMERRKDSFSELSDHQKKSHFETLANLIVQLTHLAFSQRFRCFHRCRRHPRPRQGTGRCRALPPANPRPSQGGGGRECVRWTIRNQDDIILAPTELAWLRQVFQDRSVIFDDGGHCGNYQRADVLAAISRLLAE